VHWRRSTRAAGAGPGLDPPAGDRTSVRLQAVGGFVLKTGGGVPRRLCCNLKSAAQKEAPGHGHCPRLRIVRHRMRPTDRMTQDSPMPAPGRRGA
jgi:hypothetical protein